MANKITLEGLQELTAQIEKLGQNKASTIKGGLYKGAVLIRDDMNKRINKSHVKHKHLKGSIPIRIEQVGENYYAIIGFTKADNSDFFYAKFLEWGTSSWARVRGYSKKVKHDVDRIVSYGDAGMPAQPFMQPAFNSKKKQAFDKLTETVKEALHE